MRHRQRRITKLILPLFGLVWLQLAAVPCIGAHAAGASLAASAGLTGQPATVLLESAPAAGAPAMAPGHEHCDYCPPSEAAADGDCDDASQCAYPHEPGVDARAGGMACLPAGPVAAPISLAVVAVAVFHGAVDEIEPGRHRSLAIQYCRFIE